MITFREQQLDIDVLSELEPFMDQFDRDVVRDDKLQSCSPFREDSHPSFAVNLENGSWIDSGAVDEFHKGHFIQLLCFLREEMAEDTADYLLEKYGVLTVEVSELTVDMSWLHPKPKPKIFFTEDLQPYAFRHPYLESRGISETVQRAFRIGYDPTAKAVMMPWCDKDGHVINMKFRSTVNKRFWYHKEGQRVKHHLYGADKLYEQQLKIVWLVESEIDCLRLWSVGIPAVAFGTANMSVAQEQILLNSSVETAVIAVDNDAVGKKFAQQLTARLTGKLTVQTIEFPDDTVKDISDMTDDQIINCLEHAKKATIQLKL